MTTVDVSVEVAQFGELQIAWDRRLLRPRPWTTAQSHWAAALSPYCPEGPLLELCCGAGQIGLLAATLTGRPMVQVDRDPVAAAYVRRNAAATGVRTDVRTAALTDALRPDERFGLVILDPPWVPSLRVGDHPEDPVGAIDGGLDGTDQIVLGLGVALRHLLPGGHVVVQVGGPAQVEVVRALLGGLGADSGWSVLEVRDYLPGGLLLDVGPRRDGASESAP